MSVDDRELTLAQAAAIKGVSVGTVRKWILVDQVLPAYRNGATPKSEHDTRPMFVLESDLAGVRQRVQVPHEDVVL